MSANVLRENSPNTALSRSLILRNRLLFRLFAFILLELAFLTLAITCLVSEVPCSISSSRTLTKAAFTVLVIAWQTIAIMCATEITNHSFSCEWHWRYQKDGSLIPGHTDLVSTITSGFRDRILHSFSRSASPSYRISSVVYWALFILAGMAPGSINVDNSLHFHRHTLAITNFTWTGGDTNTVLKTPIVRTANVVELEMQGSAPFGFTTENNVIVGWPNVGAGELEGDMKYASDALLYNMSCWWEAPTFNMTRWNTTWYAGGFAWYPWSTPEPGDSYDGGIMPMFRFPPLDQEFIPHNFPISLPVVEPVGISGYLFFGRNSSLENIKLKRKTFNLDNVPTTFSESGFHFIDFDGADGHFASPLASFLLCDPRARIADGKVRLSQRNTSLTLEAVSPIKSESKVGNISPAAANIILGVGLLDVLDDGNNTERIWIGTRSAQTFTNDTALSFRATQSDPFDVGVLSTDEIGRNLNRLMVSGAKAFSSFNRQLDKDSPRSSLLTPSSGAIQREILVLSGNRGFLIATICLFLVATILMVINMFHLQIWKLLSFKLENIVEVLQEHDAAPGLEKELRLSHFESRIKRDLDRPSFQNLLARLCGFVILEVLFFGLALVCSRQPLIIDLPLSSGEVKGGFTVLFILWHGIACFLLGDATAFAFSSEWSLRPNQAGRPIFGVSDRVSRLTSGSDDQLRYLFTRKTSPTFLVAFITANLLTALKSFGPGTLSLGSVKATIDTPLQIADLRLPATLQENQEGNDFEFLQDRADRLTVLEHHDGIDFRYAMNPHWLMAWPDTNSIDSDTIVGMIEYPTDVIHFDYSCQWLTPEMGFDEDGDTTWTINNQTWQLWSEPLSDFTYVGGVIPLYRYLDVQPDNNIAVLVIGTNASFPVDANPENRSIVDLSHVPTRYHPSGLRLVNIENIESTWVSPLSTVLFCDPRVEVSGGRAQLNPDKSLTVSASGMDPVGNIPSDVVTSMFSTSLLLVLDTDDETVPQWISVQTADMFLQDTSMISSMNFSAYPRGVPVYDIATLNNNFNNYALSANKAYLDGLSVNPHNASDLRPQTMSVMGQGEVEKQVLLGDKTLGIVSLCLAIFSVASFMLLVRLLLANTGEAFVLANLIPALEGRVIANKS